MRRRRCRVQLHTALVDLGYYPGDEDIDDFYFGDSTQGALMTMQVGRQGGGPPRLFCGPGGRAALGAWTSPCHSLLPWETMGCCGATGRQVGVGALLALSRGRKRAVRYARGPPAG